MPSSDRRQFLAQTGAAVGALAAGSVAAAGEGPKRIGVGLIGCGGRGNALANALTQVGKGELAASIVAVSDVYKPRMDRAAGKYKAKAYQDYHKLLADPQVQAVIIATPDRAHVYQAMDAIKAGKDIYCEKPLTHWQQFAPLQQFIKLARDSDRIIQVGTQYLSDSTWHDAAKEVQAGTIGKLVHAQTGYFRRGDWGERGMPIDDPNARPGPELNWEAWLFDAPKRPFDVSRFFRWRMYMDYAGGPCTDLYPHLLTPLLRTLGLTFPETVVAVGGKYYYDGEREVPDTFDLLIRYPEKVTVAVLGTIANAWPLETVVRGSDGTIQFGGPGLVIELAEKQKRRQVKRTSAGSTQAHMANFIHCVRTRQQPNAPLQLAYYAQVALIMGMISYVERRAVHFDAEHEKIV